MDDFSYLQGYGQRQSEQKDDGGGGGFMGFLGDVAKGVYTYSPLDNFIKAGQAVAAGDWGKALKEGAIGALETGSFIVPAGIAARSIASGGRILPTVGRALMQGTMPLTRVAPGGARAAVPGATRLGNALTGATGLARRATVNRAAARNMPQGIGRFLAASPLIGATPLGVATTDVGMERLGVYDQLGNVVSAAMPGPSAPQYGQYDPSLQRFLENN